MTDRAYNKLRKKRINRKAQQEASEARSLSREMQKQHPSLTPTQTLLSAYVLSGRGNLCINSIKLK